MYSGRAIDADGPALRDRLREATRLIAHRGPDDEAFYLAPGFSAGFRRLRILDLSERGRQPMADEAGRYWIVFNGEIYNYRELRDELGRAGWSFRTATDTEVLLRAYIQWGEECLGRLNGMFAFLVWDSRERRLFGARDRFGEKPLFYAEAEGRIAFASEIKALLPLLGRAPDPHAGVVRNYLQFGVSDDTPETFYRGIRALPAAHKLVVSDGRLRVGRYWRLESSEDFRGDPVGAFRELFLDSVRLRTRSDVPVGTCLSGGLDSGSIVCGLRQVLGEDSGQVTRKTFTASYREFDEGRYVDLVNRRSGSQGHAIVPRPAGLADLERLIGFHDEPFHSFTAWVGHEVMRLARERGIVVLLNGQGSDELLAGYPESFPLYLGWLLRRGRIGRALEAARGARALVGRTAVRSVAHAATWELRGGVARLVRKTRLNRARRARRIRHVGLADCCLRPEFLDRAEQDTTRRVEGDVRDAFKGHLHEALFGADLPLYLRVEDRNSMALSMESRLPFLDHRLAELVFSLPSDWLMRGGANKYLLREGMEGILPDEVRLRGDKYGFPVPEGGWIYRDLRDQVEDLLGARDADAGGVFDAAGLRARFAADAEAADPGAVGFWFRTISYLLWSRALGAGPGGPTTDPTARPAPVVNASYESGQAPPSEGVGAGAC